MSSEKSPLDLNNLPDDFTRDGKQVLEEGSSSGNRRKKNGGSEGKEDCGKVYECRFCSLKFCKSQALGGHMNRHRQERETETLYKARQIVFGSDGNLAAQGPHIGCQAIQGSYLPTGHLGDPALPYRQVYPPRYFSAGSSTLLQPPPPPPPPQTQQHQPYLYPSPSRLMSYPSQYPHQQPVNDYCIGHVLGSSSSSKYSTSQMNTSYPVAAESNYTCIGAPVGHGFLPGNGGGGGGRDGTLHSYAGTSQQQQQQRLDPSAINRYQDGF